MRWLRKFLGRNVDARTANKAASLSVWSQRSRDYLARLQAEAPTLAADWKLFDELDQSSAAYRPHFTTPPDGISDYYRHIESAPGGMLALPFLIDLGIEGFLHKAEALKLYEMGYYAKGDILELGTHKGLSTSILAHALHDRGSGHLVTYDIDPATNTVAQNNLAGLPGAERVNFNVADAKIGMDDLIKKKRMFDFIFVDHWHGYDATYDAAARVPRLLSIGGYAMFHDFFDPSNRDPAHVYGVYPAVVDAFGKNQDFIFSGAVGGAAIFQKVSRLRN
jgi:hypothetical protein